MKYRLCFAFLFIPNLLLAQFLGQQSLSQSSYVIDQSGTLWAWGWNFYGQLGVGDRVDRDNPTVVPLPPGASKWTCVTGGATFAVAIADTDKLYAWGVNDKGQIGQGYAGNLFAVPTRIPNPPSVTGWKWVSAGAAHCEALTNDGRLFAWGDNSQGQLGPGNTKYLPQPEQVEFPTGVRAWTAVAAGPGYSQMISQDGLLYGCGMDSLGTFQPWEGPNLAMNDTFRAYSPLPCLAASFQMESRIDQAYQGAAQNSGHDPLFYVSSDGGNIESVASVADGGWHALALSMFGTIAAYGSNKYGQLGSNDTNFTTILVPLPKGVYQFVAVAAGLRHSLAIGDDGWLYTWGDDSVGELGNGTHVNTYKPTPVLRVCPPLAMSGTISLPTNFYQPYNIKLTITNDNSTGSLTNANSFLVLASPLLYGNAPPAATLQSPLAPKASSSNSWDGILDPLLVFDSVYPSYFAYVRAQGSAPLLVWEADQQQLPTGPWRICDQAIVVDSLTGAPLQGAQIVFPGPPIGAEWFGQGFDSNKMVSQSDGSVALCFKGPVNQLEYCPSGGTAPVRDYPINVMKENCLTTRYGFAEPFREQTKFPIGPSPIQGTFTNSTPSFGGDSILKIYYPDSMIGYAISRRVIFRTEDSGITWTAKFESEHDLHDLKFFDQAHGWAVGDSGTILSTSDSGATWQQVPIVTAKNLRSVFTVDFDTSWAVGDSGTIIKRADSTWALQPSQTKADLYAVHFVDKAHGAIGGNGTYLIYQNGVWSKGAIAENIRSVYGIDPNTFFFAGTKGSIVQYHIFVQCVQIVPYPPFFDTTFDTLVFDSTYTTKTINSIYFLNPNVGYAVGDSGASFVTYDNGTSWASMTEFPHSATSVNFFSLAGHAVTDNTVLNYTGMPSSISGIVRGRITYGNPPMPILGARVDRIYAIDTLTNLIESAYSNEQGNFVFTGIDTFFHYRYQIHFEDSGIQKQHSFDNIKVSPHEIITLNYNDYAPPQIDTVLSVGAQPAVNASLEIIPQSGSIVVQYSTPLAGFARLRIQDILGRTLRDEQVETGEHTSTISFENFAIGTYYLTLETSEGPITKPFTVIR